MDLELRGQVAVVTGAASGIGLACARGLAREGCRVALWDVDSAVEEQAAVLASEAGGSTMGVVADVGDLAAVEAAMCETEDELGAAAHLVHAAAVGSGKFGFPFTNLEPV